MRVVVVSSKVTTTADLTITSFQVAEFRITGTVPDRNLVEAATLYAGAVGPTGSAQSWDARDTDTGPSPLKSSFAAHHANLGASAGLLRSIATLLQEDMRLGVERVTGNRLERRERKLVIAVVTAVDQGIGSRLQALRTARHPLAPYIVHRVGGERFVV